MNDDGVLRCDHDSMECPQNWRVADPNRPKSKLHERWEHIESCPTNPDRDSTTASGGGGR